MNKTEKQGIPFEEDLLGKDNDELFIHLNWKNKTSKDIDLFEQEFLDSFRRAMHQYVTPSVLVKFLANIIEPKDHEVVLDPVCGTGSFLKEIRKINSNTSLFGIDIDKKQIDFANKLNELRNDNITYVNQDSLEPFPTFIPKADYIFANLPFGVNNLKKDVLKDYEIQSKRLDVLLIQKIIDSLKEGGIAFIIITEDLLFSTPTKNLRDYISKKVSLDAILSLPVGTFAPYTNIKTSILILSKRKRNRTVLYELDNVREDSLLIKDIRNYLYEGDTSYGIPVGEFSRRTNWTVSHYLNEIQSKELFKSIPFKYKLVKLEDICEIKSLSPKEIKENSFDLIISSRYNPGKLLLWEDIEEKGENSRYYVLNITDPKVSSDYLRVILNSPFGKLENISSGLSIKVIKSEDLNNFEIPIVENDIQNEIIIKLNNIKAIKDKFDNEITKIEKVERGNFFKEHYEPDESLSKLITKWEKYHSLLPKPIAISYYSYKNTNNIDKKFDNIITSFSTIIKTLGLISLIGLSTVSDEELPSKIRGEIDITKPISDGVWGKIIQLAVKRSSDMNCFLSEELKYIDYKEIVALLNELTESRNLKAHSTRAFSEIEKKAFIAKFQTNLERLVDLFSFLANFPLVYFEGTKENLPKKIVYTFII